MYSNFTVRNPSDKKFGVTFSIIFTIIFLYFLIIKEKPFYFLLYLSSIFIILSFVYPKSLSLLNKIWMKFGVILGSIVSQIVMLIVFISVFITIGLLLKLFKKDVLNLKINKKIKSYWNNTDPLDSNMENQY